MRAHRHTCFLMPCRKQGGAAALITVLFLLIVVAFSVLVSLNMSGSDVSDSTAQHNSVQALFLAESAIERASGRYAAATPCASLAPDSATLASGSFTVATATLVGANCQIRVIGTAAGTTRTVDAVLKSGGGAITADTSVLTPSWGSGTSRTLLSYTVPANASILLVGLSINNVTATINSVTYGGTAMTPGPLAVGQNPWPRAQIYYLVNPPVGTANVVASFSQNSEVVMGARWFSGVNTSTGTTPPAPFDVVASTNTGNGNPKIATVPITPATNGAWVFEVTAIDNNDTTTMTPQANRLLAWYRQSNGNVRGGASTIGPISPAVALRPGGSPSLLSWSEVVQ
jgi:hypothetical protein